MDISCDVAFFSLCVLKRLPHKLFRQNIVFSYPDMIRVSFSSFLSLSLFDVILNFYKKYFISVIIIIVIIIIIIIIIIIFFFHEKYFYFFMFRDVPGSSGMFCVSGFIDTPMFNDQRQLICNRK